MKIVKHLRPDAARLAGLGLAVGLTAVSVIDVARAQAPAAPPAAAQGSAQGSTLARSLFAPVTPATVAPELSDQVRKALSPVHPASFVTGLPARPEFSFEVPLPGYAVNSPFGVRQLSFEPRARIHEGVDIAAPIGTEIHATAEGRVSRTGLSSSYGHFVEVAHGDGLTSFYAHMSRTAGLRVGAVVVAGEVLGFVGSTGHSTGPHLHFEIRKDGSPLDPQAFMGRQFASLADLPLTQARAPSLFARVRQPFHMLASWHVRGRAGNVRLAAFHRVHVRYARG
jgi:murein DD-endopeptidase MepM/ murein hydrolase activator NlpD